MASIIAQVIIAIITITPATINIIISKRTNKKVNELQEIRLITDRRYLVNELAEIENGTKKTEEQKKEIYSAFDEYTKLGGNSYIHNQFEKLQKQNKI